MCFFIGYENAERVRNNILKKTEQNRMNSIEILATKHNKSMHLMFATFFVAEQFEGIFLPS